MGKSKEFMSTQMVCFTASCGLTKGTYSTFNVPGAGTGPGQGTLPESNNTPGTIAGNYLDGNGVDHGFLFDKQGKFSVFDVPGMGTGAGQGTFPWTTATQDTVTGRGY